MTNETIADIAAEKRRIAKEVRDYASNGDYWDRKKANETAEDLEEEADRLEAAHKRERAKIEADALEVGGIVEAAHRREISERVTRAVKNTAKIIDEQKRVGDAAKLREAVKAVVDVGYPHNFQREAPHIRGYCYNITKAIKKCFDALATEKEGGDK